MLRGLAHGGLDAVAQAGYGPQEGCRQGPVLGLARHKHHMLPSALDPSSATKAPVQEQAAQLCPYQQLIGHGSLVDGGRHDAPALTSLVPSSLRGASRKP